jgi:hypothetical protein
VVFPPVRVLKPCTSQLVFDHWGTLTTCTCINAILVRLGKEHGPAFRRATLEADEMGCQGYWGEELAEARLQKKMYYLGWKILK